MFIDVAEEIVEGDEVNLTCSLSKWNNSGSENDLNWLRESDSDGNREIVNKGSNQ